MALEEYTHFFEVKLDQFDGPIDLLLHLVKQNELPIATLSLAQVTSQYLNCIEQARQYDLEVAGEYLVIAATLLSIKSSFLLNEPVELLPDEDGNLVNPHEELLRKLREAEIYKDGAYRLSCQKLLGVDVFAPPSCLKHVTGAKEKFIDHDPMLLGRAFRKLLSQVGQEAKFYISVDPVSIMERMMTVIETLKTNQGRVAFYKLVPDLTSRNSIVGTFIALLELCKRQVIRVEQTENFEDITIVLAAEDAQVTDLSSEFDQPEAEGGTRSIANG